MADTSRQHRAPARRRRPARAVAAGWSARSWRESKAWSGNSVDRLSYPPHDAASTQPGASVAILFKTTAAALARWRPHLPGAFPGSRDPLLAGDRRRRRDRLRAGLASRAGAARQPAEPQADRVAGRRDRPHPARSRFAGRRPDHAAGRPAHDPGDVRVRRAAGAAAASPGYRLPRCNRPPASGASCTRRTPPIAGSASSASERSAKRPDAPCGRSASRSPAGADRQSRCRGSPPMPARLGWTRCSLRSDILVCLLPMTPRDREHPRRRDSSPACRAAPPSSTPGAAGTSSRPICSRRLASGQLAAAVLDVFRDEPLPPEHPFWRHPRIVITPHVAADTNPPTAAPIIAAAIRDFEAGRPVANLVDPARGY